LKRHNGDVPPRELTDLERGVVFALASGAETTLLVLELLNHHEDRPHEPVDEARLAEALWALDRDGIALHRTEHREPLREPGGNIPEWAEGRSEVVWWYLSKAGIRRLEDLRRRLR